MSNSNYKEYLRRQLGIKKSQSKLPPVLREGISGLERMLSPTAVSTPIIAVGIRGSSTGGLPSGADQTNIPSNTPTGRLGGYEKISVAKDNSDIFNKTPSNSQINSPGPIANDPKTINNPHPHQVQADRGEPPQMVTGASTDSDPTLTVKPEMQDQGTIDIDVNQEESRNPNDMDGEESMEDEEDSRMGLHESGHKKGCTCGFCKNKGSFGKKKKDDVDEGNKDEKKNEEKDDMTEEKTPIKEKYSPPFARMRGLANLGERRVASNGLWESVGTKRASYKVVSPNQTDTAEENKARTIQTDPMVNEVGASEPFNTKWKMDDKKAGMVKVSEVNYTKDRNGKDVIAVGAPGSDVRNAIERGAKCKSCGYQFEPSEGDLICPDCDNKEKNKKTKVNEKITTKRLEEVKMKLDKKSKRGKLNDKETMLQERINMSLGKHNKSDTRLNETFERHKKLMTDSFVK